MRPKNGKERNTRSGQHQLCSSTAVSQAMDRRVFWLWLTGAAGLVLLGMTILHTKPPLPPTVILSNGSKVQLISVTRGTNHVGDLRTPIQKLLQFAPARWIPARWVRAMPYLFVRTPTNSTVLWLYADKVPFAGVYAITDTNGFGGFISAPEPFITSRGLFPLVLKEWPRRDPRIAITFLDDFPRQTLLGRLVIANPERSSRQLFNDEPSSAATNGSLELKLVALDVLRDGEAFSSRAGPHWACRMRFQIADSGKATEDWIVQSVWLSDSGGNRRSATGPRSWTKGVYEMFGTPLFLDDPLWKMEADLTRVANFVRDEVVTFTNVVMPGKDGADESTYHTNLLGHALTLRSMRNAQVMMTASKAHNMGAPGLTVEIDSRNADWVPRIISILSDSGEAMPVPVHGYGDGYALMRFSAPAGAREPKTLIIKATVQKRRPFTLYARPHVLTEP